MNIINTHSTYNIHGYVDRVERIPSVRRTRDINIVVNHPTYVPTPKIENFENLVVAHNIVESYI